MVVVGPHIMCTACVLFIHALHVCTIIHGHVYCIVYCLWTCVLHVCTFCTVTSNYMVVWHVVQAAPIWHDTVLLVSVPYVSMCVRQMYESYCPYGVSV